MDAKTLPEQIDADSFATGEANTEISYLYRDADNYKQAKSVVLEGALTIDQAAAVVGALQEGEWFVPSEIGLEDIQGNFTFGAKWDKDSDHPFHELTGIALTSAQPFGDITAQEFHDRFMVADWSRGEARVMAEHA